MKFLQTSFLITLAAAKVPKISDILDSARQARADSNNDPPYGNLRASSKNDDAPKSGKGNNRQGAERWESLWADGAVPQRLPVNAYSGGVVTPSNKLGDVPQTPVFEGTIVTWDCGNEVSLVQELSFGNQAAQGGMYVDALGQTYGVAGLIMDFSVSGQEKCPVAVPALANGGKRDHTFIAWRRVVGAQDTLVGKVYTAVGQRINYTGQMRVLVNNPNEPAFTSVQLFADQSLPRAVFAAFPLEDTSSRSSAGYAWVEAAEEDDDME